MTFSALEFRAVRDGEDFFVYTMTFEHCFKHSTLAPAELKIVALLIIDFAHFSCPFR